MRMLWLLVPLVLLVAGCMPSGPTGNAVAPPTHWVDGSDVLVSYDVWDEPFGDPSVRITVTGDLVMDSILVDGEPYSLQGGRVGDEWLSGRGSALVRLAPGKHEVKAYSCFESFTGWKCGCLNTDNCGNWMSRTVTVD